MTGIFEFIGQISNPPDSDNRIVSHGGFLWTFLSSVRLYRPFSQLFVTVEDNRCQQDQAAHHVLRERGNIQ